MPGWTVLFALLASGALADVRHSAMPVSLHGTWASSAQHCSNIEAAIVLAKNSYRGPKGRCSVPWVIESAGAHGTIYSAHLRCPVDNGDELSATLLLMPKGADQLSVGDDFDGLKTYERCPASGAR
jgi:hypothetical protein